MECTNECRKWFSKEHCDYCQSHYVVSKERYESITGQVRRMVIIERMEQIERLKRYQIHGIAGYVTVDADGKTCYQHP